MGTGRADDEQRVARYLGAKLASAKPGAGCHRSTVVGSVMFGYDGHRGWLNYLAVKPEHQRRGLGRALVGYAEHELAELGCAKVNLQIRRTNAGVVDFYLSLGYLVDDVISMGRRLVEDERSPN
ncbi:MAG TPA: GNAT family N-acetyltransferase [Acidimicrobiales bacterium]|nr:GNAT family N-acetyltransferase [Acidimicrobiales bacterium]